MPMFAMITIILLLSSTGYGTYWQVGCHVCKRVAAW